MGREGEREIETGKDLRGVSPAWPTAGERSWVPMAGLPPHDVMVTSSGCCWGGFRGKTDCRPSTKETRKPPRRCWRALARTRGRRFVLAHSLVRSGTGMSEEEEKVGRALPREVNHGGKDGGKGVTSKHPNKMMIWSGTDSPGMQRKSNAS